MRRQTGLTIRLILVVGLTVSVGVVGAADGLESTGSGVFASDAASEPKTADLSPTERQATDDDNQLTRRMTFERLPDRPGTVAIQMGFEIPDQVVELRTAVPLNATVSETDGFERTDQGNYTWDGDTERPSLSFSYSVNRTGSYHLSLADSDREPGAEPGLIFADTADWTIASVPAAGVYWSAYRSSPEVTFNRETAVAGEGVAGDRMVFLGPHTAISRDIGDQTITLAVPDAASMKPSREAVLDSLETAAPHLPASPVARSVVIAAPTSIDWGPYGLAEGSDTWIRANEPIADPGNVWLHEFVHIRQDFRTEADARWIVEGMPEYYAALLTLEQGHIDFGRFADHLDRGTQRRYDSSVLAEPGSWDGLANYVKGALVYGTIDQTVREESSGAYAARNLFESMNRADSRIDHAFIESRLLEMTNTRTVEDLRPFIQTGEAPTMWSRRDHGDAFGTTPPDFNVEIDGPVELTGSYRNRSVSSVPRIVLGETLTFPVTVRNEGEATGSYETALEVNGTAVTRRSGTLAGGGSESFTLDYVANETGTRTITIGSSTVTVAVLSPTEPVVSDLSLSADQVTPGETVTVTATVTNPATWPANGTLSATVDDERIATWPVALEDGETVSRTVNLTVTEPGEKRITVGSTTIRLQVKARATTEGPLPETTAQSTTNSQATTTAVETPGFTAFPPFLVLFLSVWVRRRRG